MEHPRESLICHLKDVFLSCHTDVYNLKESRICQGSSLSNETDRFILGLEMTKARERGNDKGVTISKGDHKGTRILVITNHTVGPKKVTMDHKM